MINGLLDELEVRAHYLGKAALFQDQFGQRFGPWGRLEWMGKWNLIALTLIVAGSVGVGGGGDGGGPDHLHDLWLPLFIDAAHQNVAPSYCGSLVVM